MATESLRLTRCAGSATEAVGAACSESSIQPAGTTQGSVVATCREWGGSCELRTSWGGATGPKRTQAARFSQAGGRRPVSRQTSSSVKWLQFLRSDPCESLEPTSFDRAREKIYRSRRRYWVPCQAGSCRISRRIRSALRSAGVM